MMDPNHPLTAHRQLSDDEKVNIISYRKAGHGNSKIAALIHRSESTVRTFANHWDKYHKMKGIMGRPHKTTSNIINHVLDVTAANRRSTIRAVATQDIPREANDDNQNANPVSTIGRETVRLIRHQNHFHFYDSIPVPPMTALHKVNRVNFCKTMLADLHPLPIVFTDESSVCRNMNLGGVWRRRGEIIDETFYVQDPHELSVMVWGAIAKEFKSDLIRCPPHVTSDSYEQMLTNCDIFNLLVTKFTRTGFRWQQDNATPHRRLLGKLHDLGYHYLQWPAHSPDLSPIEMVWSIIKKKLSGQQFNTQDELFEAIRNAWNSIDQIEIDKLITSFEARCHVVIQINGSSLNGHWRKVHRLHQAIDARAAEAQIVINANPPDGNPNIEIHGNQDPIDEDPDNAEPAYEDQAGERKFDQLQNDSQQQEYTGGDVNFDLSNLHRFSSHNIVESSDSYPEMDIDVLHLLAHRIQSVCLYLLPQYEPPSESDGEF
jgi:hypothetical protein